MNRLFSAAAAVAMLSMLIYVIFNETATVRIYPIPGNIFFVEDIYVSQGFSAFIVATLLSLASVLLIAFEVFPRKIPK